MSGVIESELILSSRGQGVGGNKHKKEKKDFRGSVLKFPGLRREPTLSTKGTSVPRVYIHEFPS